MADESYRLYIGIPTYGMPRSEFAIDSLATLLWHLGRHHPEIKDAFIHRDVRTYRQEARTGIVEAAKAWGATHLLMCDDDHVFSGEDFDKIWESKGSGPMISGLYMTRGLPCVPCIWKLTAQGTVPIFYYPDNELFQVDVVGFGFVLFNMKLFERINPPWFNLAMGFGEDAAFCARLLQAGIPIYAHTGAKIGHIIEQPHVITEADFFRTRDSNHARVETSKLLQIGGQPGNGGSPDKPAVPLGTRPWWKPKSSRAWTRKDSEGQEGPAEGEGGTVALGANERG